MEKIRLQVLPHKKHYWKALGKPFTGKDPQSKKFRKRQLLCGQGIRRLNGEMVEVGDTIEVDDIKEVGKAIDKFMILNPQDVEKQKKSRKMVRKNKGLKRVKDESGEGWNVLNQDTRLFINDEPISKDAAIAMVKDSRKDDDD